MSEWKQKWYKHSQVHPIIRGEALTEGSCLQVVEAHATPGSVEEDRQLAAHSSGTMAGKSTYGLGEVRPVLLAVAG